MPILSLDTFYFTSLSREKLKTLINISNMNIKDFLEITFVIAAGIAMPFIVIGSYFNLVSSDERQKPIAIFFLIVSIIYALAYSYFS